VKIGEVGEIGEIGEIGEDVTRNIEKSKSRSKKCN